MARNLVTGGFGFLGAYIVRQLLADGEEVVVFQRRKILPPGREDIRDRVKSISGDVSDWAQVLDVIKNNNIECIYHAAALLVSDCEESPAAGYRVNLTGTFNILEAARITGISDVICVGTAMTYGSLPPKRISDDTIQNPTLMYATTKLCCERLGEYYHRKYGVNFRGIRFPMVIGPGREISYYYGDYSGAVEMPARGKEYTIHVDASNPSALIYVKDVVRALIALKGASENNLRQRMYNVHGFTATMNQVAEVVKDSIPGARIDFDGDRSEEMKQANSSVSYELDNTAAQEDFDWQVRYPLDRMTEDFIQEIKAGRAG